MNTKEYESLYFELEINSNKIGLGYLFEKECKEKIITRMILMAMYLLLTGNVEKVCYEFQSWPL